MALNEASLLCPENVAEDLADALMDAGVMSVSTEDADADSPDEVPLYGEPGLEPTTQAWRNSRLKLLVDESFDIGKAVRDASESRYAGSGRRLGARHAGAVRAHAGKPAPVDRSFLE